MYAVKRYSISKARERLADVLDEAERGGSVVIERRNVLFEIRARRAPARRSSRRPLIESLDPAVTAGQWTWDWSADGLKFRPRSRRS